MFSIIIPTFNNLQYLKLCLKSLKKNSNYEHDIIIFINEGNDGTLAYAKDNSFKFLHSNINKGVCFAFNESAKIAKNKYLVLAHDDMYFCPRWDSVFFDELKKIKVDDFFVSGTMVQNFKSYIYLDCGNSHINFNEDKLLKELPKIKFNNFQGSHWQPSLVPLTTWNKVGGFSMEFSPGLGSDPDFSMKLWKIGVRLFKGLGSCRVYHFSSISLRKRAWNNGAKTFLLKWGISIKFFKKYYLRSDSVFYDILNEPKKNFGYYLSLIKCKITYLYFKIFRF
jgi:glycosyltransferase involved in cell wall biosynthesis|tara:strand:- start:39 stop:878 length:840 start_codon:yes stop_codon:yes gene_type:complete